MSECRGERRHVLRSQVGYSHSDQEVNVGMRTCLNGGRNPNVLVDVFNIILEEKKEK